MAVGLAADSVERQRRSSQRVVIPRKGAHELAWRYVNRKRLIEPVEEHSLALRTLPWLKEALRAACFQ